ncbi:BTAD domain-containing putative transcriptional regulator [Nocardia goodfellowii]|uniref:ATPase/DNA-binding SARP family transcriptional activator n=1 Tax=Nocardia goodfellowii TaxID=882446 RepID=A0ABS4Q7W4_9NOCA|nr:BTAD domain-containing putative transcriptional regulator [Nocardia goodfellowii]MBP2187777.1 putative ATPase/DNA-binding SARP family transcriptional activator [Nocardia goodfellowii]
MARGWGFWEAERVRIGLLGVVSVHGDDGVAVEVGGVRVRMLLARLALAAGRPVSVDALIDGLWGEESPRAAAGALQALVSRLRKALRGVGTVELVAGGYRLSVDAADVDAVRFEELAAQGRRELAAGRIEAAASVLRSALELWRGPALADIRDAPFAEPVADRLADLRGSAAADRFDAELRAGRFGEVLADLERAAAERPSSERLAGLRMRALAAAGRQSDALAVYEQVRTRLADELGIDPSAELREIHLALLRGELDRSAATGTAAPAETMASRIPFQRTSFVGREAELTRVTGLLADARLVTVVGSGGAGKTRLSAEVAARHPAARHGRVWFVPLASARAVGEAVLGAIGARDRRPSDDTAQGVDRIIGLLDVGEAILVLDNCEHLIEDVADLADQLLERLPDLRILATSREPLAIAGEALFPLGPLRIPGGVPDVAEIAEAPAVRLFVDRAVAARPDFVLDARTSMPVLEICRRLDGIPLALELAAAKLRSMSADQIVQRLDDRFRLLTTGSRTALPRQRTLLALVEWSWDLLDEPERVLARRLSQFPGGATSAALEAVCSDDALPAGEVVYVVGALVEKSVVEVSGDDRYRMLETIRAFAADRFRSAGDDLGVRFAEHYLAVAEAHEPLLRTRDQLRALSVLDAEHENIVAALRFTLTRADAELSARFVTALFWYWGIRGLSTQFETFLEQVLRFGDQLPERTRAALRLIRLMVGVPLTDADPIVELIAECEAVGALDLHPTLLMFAVQLAYPAGDIEVSERLLARGLAAPDPWVRACAQWMRDHVHTERGDLATGAQARVAALRDFQAVGDRWGLGMALLAVGRIHSLRGEYAEAIAFFERGVAVSAELGGEADIFQNRTQLIAARMRSGDLTGARRDIEAIQRRAKEHGYRRLAAEILFSVAELHRRTGELDAAEQAVDQLELLADRLRLPGDMAADLIAGARMANLLAAGDALGARGQWPRALAGQRGWGVSAGVAHAAELLAELLVLEGDPKVAATALGLSESIRGAFDDGEPRLVALTSELIERLGADAYRRAYRDGAALPRERALERLAEL